MELKCPACGAAITPGKNFCGECGQSLRKAVRSSPTPTAFDKAHPPFYTPKHLVDKILNTRRSMEGERKLVTVMFADVAGFTSLSEKLEPEEVRQESWKAA